MDLPKLRFLGENNEICLLFKRLINEFERIDILNNIKHFIDTHPANVVVPAIRCVGIKNLLRCLNDEKNLGLVCEVIKMTFDLFEPGEIIKFYLPHIMFLLRHQQPCVRILAMEEVYRSVSADPYLLPVPQFIDVFVAIAQQVCDSGFTIAFKATAITSNLPLEAYPKVLDEMKIVLQYDSSSKCNAFEVVINISTKSLELFELCVEHEYFDNIISDMENNDVLYQLNILELLSRLSVKLYGLKHLIQQGLLKRISEKIDELPNESAASFLTLGYIKLFGCVGHFYPRLIFTEYPNLINFLFETILSNNTTMDPVSLDTLAFIGCTVEGKLSLVAVGRQYMQTLERITQMIKNSTTEMKIRALQCFASLIGIDKDLNYSANKPVDHRVTLMTREWFRSLSSSPSSIEYLLNVCKNPFPDIKMAAFALLDAVCQHQWGEELVATTAGFIEYLLDRNVDHTTEIKEAKYDVIKRLLGSAAFDANILSRLQTYVDQGPFCKETAMEVAVEEVE